MFVYVFRSTVVPWAQPVISCGSLIELMEWSEALLFFVQLRVMIQAPPIYAQFFACFSFCCLYCVFVFFFVMLFPYYRVNYNTK